MLNSMLPLSMLNWCRSYSFDDNIFEVDVPVFDVSYFLLSTAFQSNNIFYLFTYKKGLNLLKTVID